MTRVLFLFTQTEMETAEELKDVLQARLGSAVNLTSSLDVIAEDSSLKEAVHQSRCIVLLNSQQCEEYLNKGTKEIEDGYVTFDGSFIKACLKENDVISKMLVVHFGQEPGKLISTRVPARRVFQLRRNFLKSNATVDQVVDAIRGIVRQVKI